MKKLIILLLLVLGVPALADDYKVVSFSADVSTGATATVQSGKLTGKLIKWEAFSTSTGIVHYTLSAIGLNTNAIQEVTNNAVGHTSSNYAETLYFSQDRLKLDLDGSNVDDKNVLIKALIER